MRKIITVSNCSYCENYKPERVRKIINNIDSSRDGVNWKVPLGKIQWVSEKSSYYDKEKPDQEQRIIFIQAFYWEKRIGTETVHFTYSICWDVDK